MNKIITAFFLFASLQIQGMSERASSLQACIAKQENSLRKAVSKLSTLKKQHASQNQTTAQRKIIAQKTEEVRYSKRQLWEQQDRDQNVQDTMNILREKKREKVRTESDEKCRKSCYSVLQKSLLACIAINAALIYFKSTETLAAK